MPAGQDKTSVSQYFSETASYWSQIYDPADPQFHTLHNLTVVWRKDATLNTLKKLAKGEQWRIADLGCGSGQMVEDLSKIGFLPFAFDISYEMALRTSKRHVSQGTAIPTCRSDTECIPLKDEALDAVVSLGVLMYLPDNKRAVQEMARIIRPGGYALISLPNILRLNNLLDPYYYLIRGASFIMRKVRQKKISRGLISKNLRNAYGKNANFSNRKYRLHELRSLFARSGFELQSVQAIGFSSPTFWGKKILPPKCEIQFSTFLSKLCCRSIFRWLEHVPVRWVYCYQKCPN